MSERRFDERLGPILLAIGAFGAGTAFLVWQMFITGGQPDMSVSFLNPTASNPVAWVGLVACGIMVVLSLWRLLFARDVVVLEPEQVRFGYGGRRALARGDVAEVETLPPDAVRLHLREGLDEATRRRAGVKDPQQTWVPIAGQFHDAEQLPPEVEVWFRGG